MSRSPRFALVGGLALALCGTLFGPARAAERAGKTDFFLLGHFSSYNETEVDDDSVPPIDVEYDQALAGGLGAGYHLTEQFNLNATVAIGAVTLDIGPSGVGVESDATFVAPDLNLDYHLLADRDLTPFVTAGAGLMIFTGDVDETDFSYGVGGGVRWDFSERWFLKAWYRAKWFELDDTKDPLLLHTINVALGLRW